eukprot:TRINITY_DN5988_c0_g1_i1.p1 TRINITY_DN5988_c0_g1~~TRINITY_DN5988_c0_g1_i1.p1  ORF type:complete len:926 (+),score=223.46 TRINITY_DN5988_c0_g1_i1:309-2780(+)
MIEGIACQDLQIIRQHYFRNGFISDFVCAFPLDLFALATGPAYLPFFRVGRLLKMSRLSREIKRLEKGYKVQNPASIRIARVFSITVLVAHITACVWFWVGRLDESKGWVVHYELKDEDHYTQYIVSLYWAFTVLTTVGFGDITPQANMERIFAMFVILCGAGLFATTFGIITNLVASKDRGQLRFTEKFETVREFMKVHNLDKKLQKEIFQYYNFLWARQRGFETEVLDDLPTLFRARVAAELYSDLIIKSPLFRLFSPAADAPFLNALAVLLKSRVVLPGEYVVRKGHVSGEMFFLVKGKMELVASTAASRKIMKESQSFGERGMLLPWRSTHSVRALSLCETLTLSREDFDNVLDYFSQYRLRIFLPPEPELDRRGRNKQPAPAEQPLTEEALFGAAVANSSHPASFSAPRPPAASNIAPPASIRLKPTATAPAHQPPAPQREPDLGHTELQEIKPASSAAAAAAPKEDDDDAPALGAILSSTQDAATDSDDTPNESDSDGDAGRSLTRTAMSEASSMLHQLPSGGDQEIESEDGDQLPNLQLAAAREALSTFATNIAKGTVGRVVPSALSSSHTRALSGVAPASGGDRVIRRILPANRELKATFFSPDDSAEAPSKAAPSSLSSGTASITYANLPSQSPAARLPLFGALSAATPRPTAGRPASFKPSAVKVGALAAHPLASLFAKARANDYHEHFQIDPTQPPPSLNIMVEQKEEILVKIKDPALRDFLRENFENIFEALFLHPQHKQLYAKLCLFRTHYDSLLERSDEQLKNAVNNMASLRTQLSFVADFPRALLEELAEAIRLVELHRHIHPTVGYH